MLDDHDVLASIGSVGDAYDNALAESFVDSYKTELIADRVWCSRAQLELETAQWVGWFNRERLHGSLGDIPPVEFEALCAAPQLQQYDTHTSLPLLSAQAASRRGHGSHAGSWPLRCLDTAAQCSHNNDILTVNSRTCR